MISPWNKKCHTLNEFRGYSDDPCRQIYKFFFSYGLTVLGRRISLDFWKVFQNSTKVR